MINKYYKKMLLATTLIAAAYAGPKDSEIVNKLVDKKHQPLIDVKNKKKDVVPQKAEVATKKEAPKVNSGEQNKKKEGVEKSPEKVIIKKKKKKGTKNAKGAKGAKLGNVTKIDNKKAKVKEKKKIVKNDALSSILVQDPVQIKEIVQYRELPLEELAQQVKDYMDRNNIVAELSKKIAEAKKKIDIEMLEKKKSKKQMPPLEDNKEQNNREQNNREQNNREQNNREQDNKEQPDSNNKGVPLF